MSEDEAREPRKVYWTGKQWCVTDYGLETVIEDRYYVEAEMLGGLTHGETLPIAERLRHVGSSKRWVDIEDLAAAFAVALAVHAGRYPPLPAGAFANALAHLRRVRWMDADKTESEDSTSIGAAFDRLKARAKVAQDRNERQPFMFIDDPHPESHDEQQDIMEREWRHRRAADSLMREQG